MSINTSQTCPKKNLTQPSEFVFVFTFVSVST